MKILTFFKDNSAVELPSTMAFKRSTVRYSALFWIVLVIIGCHTPQTLVRQDTLVVKPPVIADSGYVNYDPLFNANWNYTEIVKHDTTVIIRYVDKEHRVFYRIKPDSIVIIRQDTVQIAITETLYKPTFWQKISFGSIGAIVGIFLIGVLFFVRKMGWI